MGICFDRCPFFRQQLPLQLFICERNQPEENGEKMNQYNAGGNSPFNSRKGNRKLGTCMWGMPDKGLDGVKKAAELGFSGISMDISLFDLPDSGARKEKMAAFLNAGKEIDTDFLLSHVWGSEEGASSDTVWLYISYLRGKLKAINSRAEIKGRRGGSFCLAEL